jgi:ribosome-associated translation inhibitor RaiA
MATLAADVLTATPSRRWPISDRLDACVYCGRKKRATRREEPTGQLHIAQRRVSVRRCSFQSATPVSGCNACGMQPFDRCRFHCRKRRERANRVGPVLAIPVAADVRIYVTDIGSAFASQTRAYAEYRIFSSVARFSEIVHEANISLTSRRAGDATRCVVSLTVRGGGCLRVSARGRHAYDAINRAARRVHDELRRRAGITLVSQQPLTREET